MRFEGIRTRVLLAAVLPVTLVGILLSGIFVHTRTGDIEESHAKSTRSLARQAAKAAEYSFVSGNLENLALLAAGAQKEPNVVSVSIVNPQGRLLAEAAKASFSKLPELGFYSESRVLDPLTGLEILVQPVVASQADTAILDGHVISKQTYIPKILGYVVLEISRSALELQVRNTWAIGFFTTVAGLIFGVVLAGLMGQGVVTPVERVSDFVMRIAQGNLSDRLNVNDNDPLKGLQLGLNQMAEKLEEGRDQLELRIALATQALREKKEEAESATRAKSHFLAAASHDLRQPIHALGMFVTRLGQLPHDPQSRQLVDYLGQSVDAIQNQLDGLLDISRLEAKAVAVNKEPFALSSLFEQMRPFVALQARGKKIDIRIRATDIWVLADPFLLGRVLQNLLSNAVRYTPTGAILLACRPLHASHKARIEVWDTGIGIAPEHQSAIFSEFYQIDNQERDRTKGLGLGLNIVKRTADLMGCVVELQSRVGHGTRFSVVVPMTAPVDKDASPTRQDVFDPNDLAGLQVLVVEDDPLVAHALEALLDSWGCKTTLVDSFHNSQAAVTSGQVPDLILSDYRLRGQENGIDTVIELRRIIFQQTGVTVAACLMSGDTGPDLIVAARSAGLPLLHKPVRPAKLRSLMRHLVQTREEGR
jgi:signal transduction histidine kinase